MSGSLPEAYTLIEVAVNGTKSSARRSTRAGSQTYIVSPQAGAIGDEDEVTVTYTLRVLVQRHSHLLHVDIGKPTRDLTVQLAYGGCDIRYVNVIDYLASSRQPRITRLPASEPTPSIEVALDGWVMPKAGVGFVWVLASEISQSRRKGELHLPQ